MIVNYNKIKIKNNSFETKVLNTVIAGMVIVTLYSLSKINIAATDNNPILHAHYFRIPQMIKGVLSFNVDIVEFIGILVKALLSTLGLAFLSTLGGLSLGTVLALLSAKNLSDRTLGNVIRGVSAAVRAIPTFIIVLLCISIYGMTGTSAVIGMIFHSIAFFVKVLGETFEEVDEGAIESIRALGGSWFDVVHAVVIPSSITKMVAWSAFRLEINFGVAVIMGPIAAVNNSLGTELKQAVATYNFTQIFIIVLVVFLSMYVLQQLSNRLKEEAKVD